MPRRRTSRATVLLAAVVAATATVGTAAHTRHSTIAGRGKGQARDAAAVLRDMRAELGGDAVLDGVTAFTVSGTVHQSFRGISKGLSIELSVLLPDRFLDVRRDRSLGGPMPVDITYYRGFRGDALIRRTDSDIQFPPDPGPQTPDAVARRARAMTLANKQQFARLALVLFGRAFSCYPLDFIYAGTAQRDGRSVEALEASAEDGYRMRVEVDAGTHRVALITYQGPQIVTTTMSSRVTTRAGDVVSQEPAGSAPPVNVDGLPMVEYQFVPSDYKLEDGLNWPHRISETVGSEKKDETEFGRFRVNPKIDAKRFEVGR